MARPIPSRRERVVITLPGLCDADLGEGRALCQSPPAKGGARSQSPGGTVRQQHGQRRTTGSNCKYQEPTPPFLGPRTD